MNENKDIRQIRHFIWDFDGTLFDTYPIIIEQIQTALGDFGHTIDPLELMEQLLHTVGVALEYCAAKFSIDYTQLSDAYTALHSQTALLPVALPMASVEKVLAAVLARGGKNFIFTHRNLASTNAYLEKYGLSRYFSDIVAPDTPGFTWKPAPDSISYLLSKHGLDPKEVAMVGDREIDLGSGRAAGVYSIHYLCKDVPQDLQCDWRFSDYEVMAARLNEE
jgi:HAD superfamily hydrolase (TIGR01509 family)